MKNVRPLRNALLALAAFAALSVAACDDKEDPVRITDLGGATDLGGDAAEPIGYCAVVEPILTTSCVGCHAKDKQGADRNGAPPSVNLDSYDDAVANADRSNARIQAGTMPPSGPLSAADKALFQQWWEGGSEEGSCGGQ